MSESPPKESHPEASVPEKSDAPKTSDARRVAQRNAVDALLPVSDREYLGKVEALCHGESPPKHVAVRIPTQAEINAHFRKVMDAWIPHPFTPEERELARREALRYLVIASRLQDIQRDISPRPLPPVVQSQLSFAKGSYVLRYWRIFRLNDLPTEILLNILRFVVWDSFRTPVPSRVCITAVCRRWREVAIEDSTLWNAVWFRQEPKQMERAWVWFERARMAVLDIRVDATTHLDDSPEEEMDEGMREILLRLFTKLSRIRMLIFSLDDGWKRASTVVRMFEQYARPGCAPILERFEIHRGGFGPLRIERIPPTSFYRPFLSSTNTPALNYISLNGVSLDWTRSVLRNLTTLDIRRIPTVHSPNARRFRQILQLCPLLKKLTLDGAGPRFDEGEEEDMLSLDPVQLPHLRVLVIADMALHYVLRVMSLFNAPNIIELTLMNLCGEDYTPLFVSITGQFPHVRILTTYSIQFDFSGHFSLTKWIDSMPDLAYLRIANIANPFWTLFFRMHEPDNHNCIAPHLKTIDCQSVDPIALVTWVQQRRTYGTPLEKVYISEELQQKLAQEQLDELTSMVALAKLPKGATTPEERALNAE